MIQQPSNSRKAIRILILEDDAERRQVMSDCLADRFAQYGVAFFETAPAMIKYVNECDPDTLLLISLDHDLECVDGGDPGTGRDVADCLAARSPTCPVIIHSTNAPAAVGMQTVLDDSGWETVRVAPYDSVRWIGETWFQSARNAIVDDVGRRSKVSLGQS